MKNINPKLVFGLIVSFIGSTFLLVTIISSITFLGAFEGGNIVRGIVSYIDKVDDRIYVDYTYEDETYMQVPLNTYSDMIHEGEYITLSLDTDDPSTVVSSDLDKKVVKIMILVFGLTGGALLTVGIICFVSYVKNRKLSQQLKMNGISIDAQLDYSGPSNLTVNGRPAYIVKCSYYNPADGVTYKFKSGFLKNDPSMYLESGTVRVYVDENNYKRYYVDVSDENIC